jgi:hypothetical protein
MISVEINLDHLPVLGVTHGHLGGPGAAEASRIIIEPITAAPAPSGATLAAFRAAGRAEGGPTDEPAALRRAAPACGAIGGRPILPVDARLQKESLDASEAHDTLSDCIFPLLFPPPAPARRSSSDRRSSMDGSTPLAAAAADGTLFLETLLSAVARESWSLRGVISCGLSLPPPAPADGGRFGDDGLRAAPATLGPTADMPAA